MSECVRCGDAEAAPGQLGDRCPDCVEALLEDDDRDSPELTLIVSPVHGDTRRLEIESNPDPGAPYLLTEMRWTGCAFKHQGTEQLDRVEIDGVAYHGDDELVETEAGP